jgi:hypothetical protein
MTQIQSARCLTAGSRAATETPSTELLRSRWQVAFHINKHTRQAIFTLRERLYHQQSLILILGQHTNRPRVLRLTETKDHLKRHSVGISADKQHPNSRRRTPVLICLRSDS